MIHKCFNLFNLQMFFWYFLSYLRGFSFIFLDAMCSPWFEFRLNSVLWLSEMQLIKRKKILFATFC